MDRVVSIAPPGLLNAANAVSADDADPASSVSVRVAVVHILNCMKDCWRQDCGTNKEVLCWMHPFVVGLRVSDVVIIAPVVCVDAATFHGGGAIFDEDGCVVARRWPDEIAIDVLTGP